MYLSERTAVFWYSYHFKTIFRDQYRKNHTPTHPHTCTLPHTPMHTPKHTHTDREVGRWGDRGRQREVEGDKAGQIETDRERYKETQKYINWVYFKSVFLCTISKHGRVRFLFIFSYS